MNVADLERWMAPLIDAVNQALVAPFSSTSRAGGPVSEVWPNDLGAALRYPLSSGGKRIRPAFAVAAHEALLGPGETTPGLMAAAVAVELVHTYSLVHDDLPCMDDDDLRRGRPTVHKVFGEGAAVLVGDGLLTEAFSVLAAAPLSAEVRVALVAILAQAAGHRGMIGGQGADIGMAGSVADLATLERLHLGKTAALIAAATEMGGCVAGGTAANLATLRDYGLAVGMAFQLADDVLDATQDAGEGGPPTFVRLLGAQGTAARAHEAAKAAITAAKRLPHPAKLVLLAEFAVERTH